MNITFLVRNILSWPVILGQAIAFGVLVLMIRRKINYRDLGEFTHRPIDKKKVFLFLQKVFLTFFIVFDWFCYFRDSNFILHFVAIIRGA